MSIQTRLAGVTIAVASAFGIAGCSTTIDGVVKDVKTNIGNVQDWAAKKTEKPAQQAPVTEASNTVKELGSVELAQKALNDRGCFGANGKPLEVDGDAGRNFREAVARLQKANSKIDFPAVPTAEQIKAAPKDCFTSATKPAAEPSVLDKAQDAYKAVPSGVRPSMPSYLKGLTGK